MKGHCLSLSDHGAFRRTLIAVVCVAMVLLSGSSSIGLSGADWLTHHADDRVEQTRSLNHTAEPIVRLDIRSSDDEIEESADLAEPTGDDDNKHYLLQFEAVAGVGTRSTFSEFSADRALTPFRLRVFPSRGSPSA